MSNNNMNGKDFLLGAVVGGVIGALTALLVAPKSGKELRGDIAEGYRQASEKTQELAQNVGAKTTELASTVNAKAVEVAGKVKETANVLTEDMRSWRDARREAAAAAEDVATAEAAVEAKAEVEVKALEAPIDATGTENAAEGTDPLKTNT
ncbi:YtxH domain-containing protein [Paenibacillus turpanensis]|uniref:YtxH domain-containing protein n=1 Tax=Paenibacillus turpanensis TaxID=2689078 RepID=UPI001FB7A93D|nr:YtxH domain-containing protein [Paenibacillus turpanensis]